MMVFPAIDRSHRSVGHLLSLGTCIARCSERRWMAAPAARKFSIYSLKIRIHQAMADGATPDSKGEARCLRP